jgi:hypothetical protein
MKLEKSSRLKLKGRHRMRTLFFLSPNTVYSMFSVPLISTDRGCFSLNSFKGTI